MFLVPFKLLPPCWGSERVSLGKSVYGPFKNCLGPPEVSISFTLNSCWFLQSEVMGTSVLDTGTLGGGPEVGLEPLAPLQPLVL